MASNGQHWTPAHAAENMAVEMEYSEKLRELRREKSEKVQACLATIRADRRRCDKDIASMKLDVEKRRLLAVHLIDQLKDQRSVLRQMMHDAPEACNEANQNELMRLTHDIDAHRHRLLELDEERQQRTETIKSVYEKSRTVMENHIKQLHENYNRKARELREELMATYRANREKAEAERAAQEGGEV